MKVLVIVSAVLAAAAAQFLPYSGFGYSGVPYAAGYSLAAPHYSTYNAAPFYNYAPTQYAGYSAAPYTYAPYTTYAAAVPASVSSQYHAQDELGSYSYGYADGLSTKHETKNAYGATAGQYSYVDANGQLQTVSYTADDVNGFQVQATNLPVAPVADLAAPVHALAGPAPVDDTAEVKAAKAEHQRLYNEAAAAAAAAPDARKKRSLVAPLPVQDAPEVVAAKAEHARLYAAAAAAAAAAPDTDGSAYVQPAVYSGYVASLPVQDTPEVVAAKAEHARLYAAAAAASAAAPDTDGSAYVQPAVYSGYTPEVYSGYAPQGYSGYAPTTYAGVPAYNPASGFSYGYDSSHVNYYGSAVY